MNTDPIGTFKTGNTTWTVRVYGKSFHAVAPGFPEVYGDSWDAMENHAKVLASKAKVKVTVPYVQLDHGVSGLRLEKRTATGINAGTGNVTYRDERGSAGQETYISYNRSGYLKPLSAADADRYLALTEQRNKLNAEIVAIEARYRFSGGLKAEVERAIDAEHNKRKSEGEDQ